MGFNLNFLRSAANAVEGAARQAPIPIQTPTQTINTGVGVHSGGLTNVQAPPLPAYHGPSLLQRYSPGNIAGAVGTAIPQWEQGIGQSLIKFVGAELPATAQQLITRKPTTYHFTPRESILTGTPQVQSQQVKAQNAYDSALQGSHPGLAGLAKFGQTIYDDTQDVVTLAGGVKTAGKVGAESYVNRGAPLKLKPGEGAAVSQYAQQMGRGDFMDPNVYQTAKGALLRNGVDHTDSDAVQQAVTAQNAHQVKVQGRQAKLDFINNKASVGNLGMSTEDVSKGDSGLSVNDISNPSTKFTDDEISKIAKSENTKQISKTLSTKLGPVLSDQIAPSIAGNTDPNIIRNMIDHSVNQKINRHAPPQQLVGNDIQPAEGAGAKPSEGLEAPQGTKTPQLEALTNMRDVLDSGGTVDEALNSHMESTGSNIGQAQKALRDVLGSEGFNKGNVNSSLNPEYGKLKIPEASDSETAIRNSRMVRNQVTRLGNMALEESDKLSAEDLKLMDGLRGNKPQDLAKQADNPEQFLKAAEAVKKYNDNTQALGSGQLGQDVPYRQNYGAPLLFDRSTAEAEQAYQSTVAKLKTSPGYGKGRFFNDYAHANRLSDGILKPKNQNFIQDLHEDITRRQNDLAQLTLSKGLEEAHPGQLKIGEIGSTPEGTYKQLQIPGGNKISMPSSIADEINKRAPAPEVGGALGGYDKLNANLKNLKLAGGGFHSLNVVGSYLGQQIASGKIFTPRGLGDFGGVIKDTFSDSSYQSTLKDMEGRGKLTDADAAGLKYGKGEVQADVAPSGKLGNIPILKQIHAGIFDRQIPLLKLKIFDQLTEGLDRNKPEDLKQMTDISKGLNNGFGGLNREIQGLTPQSFKRFSRVFLATDYNEGQLRTLGNAFAKGGAEGKLARQIVFGKALLFGGIATGGAIAGGEFQGKDPKSIAFDIIHKAIDPSFTVGGYKVGLPTTQIAEVAKPIEQTITGVKTGHNLQGLQNFATNRLGAVPAAALEIGGNRNYLGQHIYGSDSHGQPISPLSTLTNLSSLGAPIPVAQAAQTATGNQSPLAALANTIGIRTTPQHQAASLPVDQQTFLSQLKDSRYSSSQINATSDFLGALKGQSQARKNASNAIDKDLAKGDLQKAQQDANNYNQALIKQLAPIAKKNSSILDDQQISSRLAKELQSASLTLDDSAIQSRLKSIMSNPKKYGIKTPALAGGQ